MPLSARAVNASPCVAGIAVGAGASATGAAAGVSAGIAVGATGAGSATGAGAAPGIRSPVPPICGCVIAGGATSLVVAPATVAIG